MKNIIFFSVFLIVVLIGGLLVSVSFYKDSVNIGEEAAKSELQMITGAVAKDLNYILSSSYRDLKLVASFFKTDELPTEKELNEIFNDYFNSNSFLLAFWFNDKNGIRKVTVPEKHSNDNGNDYSFREYSKQVKNYRKSVYVEVLSSYRPNGIEIEYEAIVIVTPVFDKNNNFIGALGTVIDVDDIEKRIQTDSSTKAVTKSGLYCVDFINSRIVAGHKNKKKTTPEFDNFIINISTSTDFKEQHVAIKTHLGKKYFVTGSLITNPAYSFDLIGIFPYEETMAFIPHFFTQIKWLMIFILGVIILALFIVIYNQTIFNILRKQIRTLDIHVSELEKQKAITDVTESDYFKDLQSKIKNLKKS
jgi:hypothetical protein